MTDFDPKMIEALGTAMGVALETPWADIPDDEKPEARRVVAAALSALAIPPKALNAIWRGEAVVVPNDPTEKQVEDGRIAMSPEKFVSHMRVLDVYAAMLAASPYAKKE